MTYIPPQYLEDTCFPKSGSSSGGLSNDLATMISLLEEKWRRFFPIVDYFQMDYTPTTVPTEDTPAGKPGATRVDDLWGEDIPASLTAEWIQPHENSPQGLAADATDCKRYKPSVQFNLPIQREVDDKTLKRFGIDNMRDVLVTFLSSTLDDLGVTVQVGDRFVYGGENYEVEQYKQTGYWLNTNVALYIIGNCKRLRLGS